MSEYIPTLSFKGTAARLFLLLVLSLLLESYCPQSDYDNGHPSRHQMGGVYCAYPFPDDSTSYAAAPKGYEAFYVSHFSRHGSRWMSSDAKYDYIYSQFADTANLTPLGLGLRRLLAPTVDLSRGHGGQLTRLGAQQQRRHALRMYHNYPSVFVAHAPVKARSSVVRRTVESMDAYMEQLRHLQPDLTIDQTTDSADMQWIAYTSPEVLRLEDSIHVVPECDPMRFLKQLFLDPAKVTDGRTLMGELHTLAVSIQDTYTEYPSYPHALEDTLMLLFTDQEFRAVYDARNLSMTMVNGGYPGLEKIPARSAVSLWRNFEEEADRAIAYGRPSATLRFAHDTSLYRMLTLLDFQRRSYSDIQSMGTEIGRVGDVDLMDRIIPMGACLQMVFFKPSGQQPSAANTLVRLVLNEHVITLPISSRAGNCYTWPAIKDYVAQRIDSVR